jgi:hypothetical protein
MPELRKILFNPADRTMGYKLWSNGFIEPIGTAPVPVQNPPFPDDWAVTNPVADISMVSWATPSGYTLTEDGEIRGFGPVIDPGVHGHLPTYGFRIWRWLFMNPNGDGSGYMFAFNGTHDRWGPTAPAISPTPDFQRAYVRDVQLDWATKKWVILGNSGETFANFTLSNNTVPANPGGLDAYRSVIVRDWNLSQPKILVGSMSGWLYSVNSWGSFGGQPVEWYGRDVLADMHLVQDGSGGLPMEIAFGARSGGLYRWYVSDPPVSQWLTPVNGSTVTTTTRPTITVGWSDPDGDTITQVDVRIFGPNLSSISTPTPTVGTPPVPRQQWLSDARTTGFVPDSDLENGTWQGFIRVKDAANDISNWVKSTWTQTVTRPATPTVSAPLVVGHAVRFTVTGTTNAAQFIHAEYSDDEGATWFPVRGVNPGPAISSSGVQVFDYEPPFNMERMYRARVASTAPALSSLWSSTVTAEVPGQQWTLMRLDDHTELPLRVDPDVKKTDPTGAGKFTPLVGSESIVLTSGWREGDLPLKVRVLSKPERVALLEFARSTETFLFRNPFSDTWFVKFTENVNREVIRSPALLNEATPIRDAHIYELNLSIVRRPDA